MTGYDFHPEAALDLDEIWEFIAAANLDAADRVIVDILAALDKLLPFPNQGHKRPDLTSRPLRFTLLREYLIAYAPDEKPLWIVAVMHGHRNPRVMAAILRGREWSLLESNKGKPQLYDPAIDQNDVAVEMPLIGRVRDRCGSRQSRPCGGSSPSAMNHLHLRETAIHKQFNSSDVTAVIGCEKHHSLRDLIRCA